MDGSSLRNDTSVSASRFCPPLRGGEDVDEAKVLSSFIPFNRKQYFSVVSFEAAPATRHIILKLSSQLPACDSNQAEY